VEGDRTVGGVGVEVGGSRAETDTVMDWHVSI
jgi:hypothetical protein